MIMVSGNTLVLFWFAAAAFFEEASWGAIYTYSVEVSTRWHPSKITNEAFGQVYPSSIRSTGSGAAMSFGRFGGIIATSIGKKLMEEVIGFRVALLCPIHAYDRQSRSAKCHMCAFVFQDPRLPFYLVALAFLLSAVSAGIARVETRGAKLPDVS